MVLIMSKSGVLRINNRDTNLTVDALRRGEVKSRVSFATLQIDAAPLLPNPVSTYVIGA